MAHRARGEDADGQKRRGAVTVKDVIADALTPIAQSYWAPGATDLLPYDPKVIDDIYQNELTKFDQSRVAILEFSQYLENYLWRNFDPQTSTFAHIMSIVLLVNEKFRDTSLNPWDAFHSRPEHFESFLQKVFSLGRDNALSIKEKTAWVLFFINCFQTMEDPLVRSVCQRLISVSMWHYISEAGLARIFKQHPRLQTAWNRSRQTAKGADKTSVEAAFFPSLVIDLLHILEHPGSNGLSLLNPQALESPAAGADQTSDDYDESVITYCERMLEFIVDLLAQLLTRRFLRPLLEDCHFLVRAKLSKLHKSREGVLFGQMLERVRFYMGFEIDDWRGVPLSESDMISQHYARLAKLQRIAFKHFPNLRPLAMASVSQIDTPATLGEYLSALSVEELKALADRLHLLSPATEHYHNNRVFLTNVLVLAHERRTSQKQLINSLPLYPDENVLWDENLVPSVHYSGDTCLALPKLNLQFLTFHDYLLRNFHLFRLESTYEIREDISKTVRRLAPRLSPNNVETIFTGWARYASPLKEFKVTQVKKPNVGETKPAVARAEITVNISTFTGAIRQEWEELKKHDVLFLLTIRAHPGMGYTSEVVVEEDAEDVEVSAAGDRHKLGVKYVRGCEIVDVMDETRSVVGERNKDGKVYHPTGNIRIYRVVLDSAQYEKDMNGVANGEEDPYKTFNLLMRRRPKENNFKAVLKTIRDLMKVDKESALAPVAGSAKQEVRVIRSSVVPSWLHDVFLGYGAPDSAQYYKLPTQIPSFEFADTFLDAEHARSCFPGSKVKMLPLPANEDSKGTGLAFRVTAPLQTAPNYDALMKAVLETSSKSEIAAEAKVHALAADTDNAAKRVKTGKSDGAANGSAELASPTRRKAPAGSQAAGMDVDGESKDDADAVVIEPLERGLPSLLASHVPRRNNVRFTPMQVEAIKSGLQPGLTMIVGPPGTGKTDVAVQIMSELFHNFPGQRTLLVTHSNHALNDLFEKIMERDIDERYLLRLGHGEAALSSEKDFSKFGRVNYMLERRMALLQHVARLARAIGVPEDVAYTCENASHFFLYHVQSRWEAFLDAANKRIGSPDASQFVADHFPFSKYFIPEAAPVEEDGAVPAPAPTLFKVTPASTPASMMATARQHYRDIERLFAEVDECRPFEVLRNYMDRGAYLLTKHAKVIAMTCTHAAIKRGDFVDLSFQYDNLVMEEAAQILEIETFIPMLLQNEDAEAGCRLKRIVLLGDHHQLPPIIKNMAFQKYSRMDQSLFTRFVRLGVPSIQLNAQGRMRPELATLWNWRYKHLGNLPNVLPQPTAAESTDVSTAVTSSSYGHIDPRFSLANPGLGHVFQFINVPDFNGQGENSPNPFFYQNLGEAEYAVQLFMLMRLLGYPAHSISIITPYKGQKHLIRDIINQRCARNPIFGTPLKVATVDKYQGQQNDYVILSLVRTRTAGHIRDVRRLIVAMSRARLGVYVLGRQSLYQNVLELAHTFNVLLTKPTKLVVIPSEFDTRVTTRRPSDAVPADALEIDDVKHIGQLVYSLAEKVRNQIDLYQKQVEEFEQKEKEAAERAAREAERKKAMAERLQAEQGDRAKAAEEGKFEEVAEKLMRSAAGEEVPQEPAKETVVIDGSVFEIPDVDAAVAGASDDDDDF